ncbi:MFS transporter [Collimonas fungivorans]|uniref:MFS transporter n=1 Tax=Collimonas fungivorans TaxID=158899 RepID=UPI003FA35E52
MPRTLLIPLIVACALFMENMDATVIATSLPVLARDLGQDPLTLKLALTSYVVGLGVFIPISGWVADRFGARTVFRAAILVFLSGSLMCAASSSLAAFVAARFLQGIGGAMMVPVGRIVIFRSVPRTDLVKAISYLTIPSQLGPVIGPPLGGFITTYFHWRWIFLINVPISILGMYLASRYIENYRSDDLQPLDMKGFVLSAIGSTLLMLGLSLIDGELLAPEWAFAMCVLGGLTLYVYLLHARREPFPLLDLRLLRIPTFRASVIGGSLFRIGLGAVPFLLPLALQVGFGMNAFHAGTITCASAFGAIFMKAIGTSVLRRYGFRSVLIWNAVLAGLALASYGLFTPTTPYLVMMAVVLLGGFFPSMQFTCLNTMAYADLDSADVSRATSLASVVQQISLGLGVTIGGLAVHLSSRLQGHSTIVAADFWPAFIVIGLFSLASIPVTRRLPLNAGSALTGHKPA